MTNLYKIENYSESLDRWFSTGVEFSAMNKSFAYRAWAMLTAHYGGNNKKYRMLKNNEVIEEWQRSSIIADAGRNIVVDYTFKIN